MTRLILASASPRRCYLLRQLGLKFEVIPSEVEEKSSTRLPPEGLTVLFARAKALDVATRLGEGLIIGADTAVVVEGEVLGKPGSPGQAFQMLKTLQGRMHQVVTGLAVVQGRTGVTRTGFRVTRVWFRACTEEQVRSYVATGEPMDKAGAYGIQGRGALLVERIEGCYFNVVGLPLVTLGELLADSGLEIW